MKKIFLSIAVIAILAIPLIGCIGNVQANAAEVETTEEKVLKFSFFTSDVYAATASATSGWTMAQPLYFVLGGSSSTVSTLYFSTTAVNILVGETTVLQTYAGSPKRVGFISTSSHSQVNMSAMIYWRIQGEAGWIENTVNITADRVSNGYNINFLDAEGYTNASITIQYGYYRIYEYYTWQQEDLTEIPKEISQAYNEGYNSGYKDGEANKEVEKEEQYTQGYLKGRQEQAQLSNGTFRELILSVVNAPITYLQSFLDIELLGTNMEGFFKGLITAALGLWLVRKIL